MKISISHLFRYPIKGFSPQPLEEIKLEADFGFPGDREFAIALPRNDFDELNPEPKRKSEFLILVKHPSLAKIDASFEHATRILSLKYEGRELVAATDSAEDRLKIVEFLQPFYEHSGESSNRLRLVAGDNEHRFTDVGTHSRAMMHSISLLNLNSVREVEKIAGQTLDVRRFRANIIVDGLPAWAEQSLVGKEFTLGKLSFQGLWPTSRCAATQANPDSGIRDINVPKLLKTEYGHTNLGVYVSCVSSGTISVGENCEIATDSSFIPHRLYVQDDTPEDSREVNLELERLIELGLSDDDAKIIGQYSNAAPYFLEASERVKDPKNLGKLMINELFGRLNKDRIDIRNSPISAKDFSKLSILVEENGINIGQLKRILDIKWENEDNIDIGKLLSEISSEAVIDLVAVCKSVIQSSPDNVTKFRDGKDGLLGWFVGRVMKQTKGAADAAEAKEILEKMLKT